jgi:cytochrome c oxidase assembly protein subunit 16
MWVVVLLRVPTLTTAKRLNAPQSSLSKSKLSMKPISNEDYEPVRVPRPAGVPEWGGPAVNAGAEAEPIGRRKTDRWV